VSVIVTVEEPEVPALGALVASAGLFNVTPQAVSNSTTKVPRVAEVMLRTNERMLFVLEPPGL